MSQFVLLLRSENIDFSVYSPDDYQKLLSEFDLWNRRLEEKGLLVSAGLNGKDGKTSREVEGRRVIDGPFCDTKEAITGICIINADDHGEALELSAGCPFISRGGSVEVRSINQLEINTVFKEDHHGEVCE